MSGKSDFVISGGELTEYSGPGGDVVIPAGVTGIGRLAFYKHSNLRSVTVPAGVTRIGDAAFLGCRNLRGVTLPETLTDIGEDAFADCPRLTRVTVPESVTRIGDRAFRGCGGLADAEGFVIIRGILFDYCGPGRDAEIPAGVTYIADEAFCRSPNLEGVTIPESVTEIGENVFTDCPWLKRVTIPESVTRIGRGAFRGCAGLADAEGLVIVRGILYGYFGPGGNVEIPRSVTAVGDVAFCRCRRLTGVTIPEGVTRIGYAAFEGCANLTGVTVPEGVTGIEGKTFRDCTRLERVVLPEGLTRIGVNAFRGCRALRSLRLPDSLEEIGRDALRDCGCELWIRHWIPSLGEALNEHNGVRLHTEDPIGDIPASFRSLAVLGFAAEERIDADSPRARSYLRWLREHAGAMLSGSRADDGEGPIPGAFGHPELLKALCLYGLIPPELFDACLDMAERSGDVLLKALVLESLRRIGPERIEQAREARRRATLERDAEAGADR